MKQLAITVLIFATIFTVEIMAATKDEVIYTQKFSSSKEENYNFINGSKVENGKLICTRGSFELFFTPETPVKISFKVREIKIFEGADHHWGSACRQSMVCLWLRRQAHSGTVG